MEDEAPARLSEGQRDCLRLVLQHNSSKEIARALGISPHTVDQRLRQAMRVLDASSRVEAAKRLASLEGADRYQPLIYQPSDIEAAAAPPPHPAKRDAAEIVLLSRQRETDKDASLRRIGWIVAIAAGAAVVFAALFIGLNALSEFTR